MKTKPETIAVLQSSDNPAKVSMLQALVKNPLENPSGDFLAAVETLVNDGDIAVRFWAKKVFSSLPKQSPEIVESELAAEELPFDVLLKKLEDSQSHFIANEVIRKIFEKTSPDIFQSLIKYLGNCKDEIVISFLVKNLGIHFPTEETLTIIAPYLRHTDERVVANAVEGIEAIRSPKAIVLISQMLDHNNHRVKANAAKALAKQDPETAKSIVLRMLQMKDKPHFVIAGCHAIQQIKGEEFLPELVNLITDSVVGENALDAIVGIGGEVAEGYLEAAGEVEDAELKGKIQVALDRVRRSSQLKKVKTTVLNSIHKGKDALVKIGESVKEKIEAQRESKPQEENERVSSDEKKSVAFEYTTGSKIILGSGLVAFISLFLNWVDVGFAARNGIQEGGFLFFFLISYPIYKAYKKESFNKPIAYGLVILSIILMIGYINSATIELFGRSANASSSGAHLFLISLFGLLTGIYKTKNVESSTKDMTSFWEKICDLISNVKKNGRLPSFSFTLQGALDFLKTNTSLVKGIAGIFVFFVLFFSISSFSSSNPISKWSDFPLMIKTGDKDGYKGFHGMKDSQSFTFGQCSMDAAKAAINEKKY